MIFRIFKKDWKLLWQLVTIVALVHAIAAALWWFRDHTSSPDDFIKALSQLAPLIAILGTAVVCVAAIQADPIPGDQEDWLTRPIHRSDLLTAKLLFVLVAVVAPVLVIGAGEALSDGFSFAASTGAAFGQSVALLVIICLPAMMLGAVTSSATEAIMAALIACVLGVTIDFIRVLLTGGAHPTLLGSGLTWWNAIAFSGIVLICTVVVLSLQYWRRYTLSSRLLAIPFVMLASQCQSLPWNMVFSAQQSMASPGINGSNVNIRFDPSLKRSSRTAISAGVRGAFASASLINLPIRADGISSGDVLLVDRAEIHLILNGKVVYYKDSAEFSYSMSASIDTPTKLRQGEKGGQPIYGYQAILLPASVVNQYRSRDLALQIDYSLSLFHKDAVATLGALGDRKHFDKIGWCKTVIDDDGDEVAVECVQPGQAPNCLSAVLENSATGQRDPENFACDPDYSPIPIHFVPDELARFGGGLRFNDASDVARYPVGEAQLRRAQVNLTTYQPTAHFTRKVIIHNIRLGDWEADPEPN